MERSGDSRSYQQCLRMHMDGDSIVLQQLAQDNPCNGGDYELQHFHHAFRGHHQRGILSRVGKKDVYRTGS